MNQKFSRKELERLGCTEEEVKLVMDYQKKLPVIVDNDEIEKFCVDARTLHDQLSSKRKFSEWIKTRISTYEFVESLDFVKVAPILETCKFGGDTRSENYSLSLDMAKQLSMVEKTNTGKEVRKYYILMEKLVRDNKAWWQVRNPEKKEYNKMCEAVSENIHRHRGRVGDKYDFSREANILNIIANGSSAQEIRNYFGISSQSELTRDSLQQDYNEKLAFLQKQNVIYLGMNMTLIERTKMLIASFDIIYPNASPILPWLSRKDMLSARIKLLESLER